VGVPAPDAAILEEASEVRLELAAVVGQHHPVEDGSFLHQGEDEGNRRAARRRDERPHFLQIRMAEGEHYALMEKLETTARFPGAREIITLDGLRVEYADGFGLARPSNTTPVIVLRFEADNEAALKRIQADFRRVLLEAAPDLKLPF
jgi:hypothetical protein